MRDEVGLGVVNVAFAPEEPELRIQDLAIRRHTRRLSN
jgi:hypothetical protein